MITWNTPFLFRTRPAGSRLLICGAPNYFKTNAHPLTAIIESDWISMSFTMNWKLMIPGLPVRFEVGEPLFQAIPLVSNICQDLEDASVSYQRLSDNVTAQMKGGFTTRMSRRAMTQIARRPWLTKMLSSRAILLRAPFVEHVILEDWLLEQKVP